MMEKVDRNDGDGGKRGDDKWGPYPELQPLDVAVGANARERHAFQPKRDGDAQLLH